MYWDATQSDSGGYGSHGAGTIPSWRRMHQIYSGDIKWHSYSLDCPSSEDVKIELDKIPTGGPLMVDVEHIPVHVGQGRSGHQATKSNVSKSIRSMKKLAEIINGYRPDFSLGWYGNHIAPIVPWWSDRKNDNNRELNETLVESGVLDYWPGVHHGCYWGRSDTVNCPMHLDEWQEWKRMEFNEIRRIHWGAIYPYCWHYYQPKWVPFAKDMECGKSAWRGQIQFCHDQTGHCVVWSKKNDGTENSWWRQICRSFS